LDLVDAVFKLDFDKNDRFKFGGKKWTSEMLQKTGDLRKEANRVFNLQTKTEDSIAANDGFEKLLTLEQGFKRPDY